MGGPREGNSARRSLRGLRPGRCAAVGQPGKAGAEDVSLGTSIAMDRMFLLAKPSFPVHWNPWKDFAEITAMY